MENGTGNSKKRKITNVIVDGAFQLKVVIITLSVVVIQGIISTGYFAYVGTTFMSETLPHLTTISEIQESIKLVFLQLLTAFIVVNIDCIIIALALGLYLSHKTAGPAFAIKRAILDMLDGVEHKTIILRKGDEFHDLAERVNALNTGHIDRCIRCEKTDDKIIDESQKPQSE